MAKGLDKHRERQEALSLLGKDLTRRAGSKCELCEAAGEKLHIYETPPVPAEPSTERCIFICQTCLNQLEKPKQRDNDHLRCLNAAVWSETLPVQVTAVALLREIDTDWARDLEDTLYLPPEAQEWLEQL